MKYLLGLDIGTNSVGWCVTDENYNIVKKGGKSLWGVRLFDEAKDCTERRLARGSRRRLRRRRERLDLLQEIFAEEIKKIDQNFFERLDLSKYHIEDRIDYFDSKQVLFNSDEINDKNYYKKYPTIYHLKQDMIYNDQKFDIRYLYLVLAHSIKYRGNFLYSGNDFKVLDQSEIFNSFMQINTSLNNLEEDKIKFNSDTISKISKEIVRINSISESKEFLTNILKTESKYISKVVIPLISGSTVKVKDIYKLDEDSDLDVKKISFNSSSIEEDMMNLEGGLGSCDYYDIIVECRKIYTAFFIGKLLKEDKYVTDFMLKKYNNHKKDLNSFKHWTKKQSNQLYNEIFKDYDAKINNYVKYVGSNNVSNKKQRFKKCTKEEFYEYLTKKLDLKNTKDEYLLYLKSKIEQNSFLDKLNSTDNGVFPYQLTKNEVEIILNKQRKYYDFLNVKDSEGLDFVEKIISILSYKIPYFIGPLVDSTKSQFAWSTRIEGKENEKIYPWNIKNVIDYSKTQENFINRMLSKCTYLTDEKVMPVNSITYSLYMLYSFINKININGKLIDQNIKSDLVENLYKTQKVTKKVIKDYIKSKYGNDSKISYQNGTEVLEFIDPMGSYRTFSNIFGKDFVDHNIKFIDDIIRDITIFTDPETIAERLQSIYKISDIDTIKKIKNIKYSGYGKLSKKFLVDIKTPTIDLDTGEIIDKSILKIMEETNEIMIEIINNPNYEFLNKIEEINSLNKRNHYNANDINANDLNDYVNELYVSPGMKRPLIQAYKIVEELEKILGKEIDEYYIECARTNLEKKNVKTASRKEYLLQRYKDAEAIAKLDLEKNYIKQLKDNIINIDDNKLRSDKLFLYYLQMGKCMYTGRTLSLEDIANDSVCDIDHIVPRALIKDDSIENRVLVIAEANRSKKDIYPIPKSLLFEGHVQFYNMLKKMGLMGEKKYQNLTRNFDITDDELAQFVNRQLVYTNQAVLGFINTLKNFKNVDAKKIYFSKAENVTYFRKKYEILKSRSLNSCHHAHDAYLNIVVDRSLKNYFGPIINKESVLKIRQNDNTLNIDKILDPNRIIKRGDIVVWDGISTIQKVKNNIYNKHDVLITVRQYISNTLLKEVGIKPALQDLNNGSFYPLKNSTEGATVALKNTQKYGGYNGIAYGYFTFFEYLKKAERIKQIIAMPNIVINAKSSIEAKKRYLEQLGYKDVKILVDVLRINFVIKKGSIKYIAASKNDIATTTIVNLNQLFLDKAKIATIKKIDKFLDLCKEKRIKAENADIEFPVINNSIIVSPPRTNKNNAIIITEKEVIELYLELINKLTNSIFSQYTTLNNLGIKLKENLESYNDLLLHNKIVIIAQLLKIYQTSSENADLTLLGMAKTCGRLRQNNNDSKIKIIQESITGYYSKVLFDGE